MSLKKSTKQSSRGPEIYNDKSEAIKQLQNSTNFIQYAENLLKFLPIHSGKLLDFGCGLGWLVKVAGQKGFSATGVDKSEVLVGLGKKILRQNLRIAISPGVRFNVIVANHVFEHIVAIDQTVKKLYRHLLSGGYLLVACPNIASLMYFIFRDRWYGLQPTQHVWQFTPKTLTMLLERNGFKIDRVVINSLDYQPKGSKYLIFWFLIKLANFFRIGDQVIIISHRR